ncbi:hybrid sensor histidine kinase/response regulator [Rubrivirga sp. IMCC43871]|uniref:ATP-binding response regulator n=1 Tax=Rubrivirga sp. IMCC43871 TaxID=3391575 RepID=UPI00398FF84D
MLRPRPPASAPARVATDDVHRSTYRVFCVLAGVLSPLFGVVYTAAFPDAIDPLWARFGLSVVALLLLSLSYMDARVERHFVALVRAYFGLLMLYIVGVTTANGFSYPYALGLLFALMAMGVAFTLGLTDRIAPLLHFLAFTLVATVVGGLLAPDPEAHLWLVWICAFSTALVIYVVAAAKMRAAASTRAVEHRYHTLMNAASDAILIADPASGLLIDGNEKAQEFLGRTLEEIRRMPLADLFPAAERERALEAFDAHVHEDAPFTEDVFLVGAELEVVPVDLSAGLVTIDHRAYIQAIFRRHRYEEQLVQAKERAEDLLRLKTSLLNNMSHELRTPLTAILGFSEIIAEEASGDTREYADVVRRSSQRLFDTVTSVLGLAQLEGGTAAIERRAVPAVSFVHEAIKPLRSLAENRGLTLRVEADVPADLAIETDSACLGRVLTNLVGNAIKFTEDGGVTVTLEADEHTVALHVADTGVGISPEFVPRLFEEFQQESTGLDRTFEGSGLGLAITKRLLDQIGGAIWLESEKGRGTVFTVTLPRTTAVGTASIAGHLALGPTGRRVLYVEDNEIMQQLVALRLGPYCEVVLESDPQAALARAAAEPFDAFFLDINLTDTMDGVALLAALRRLPGHSGTPAVALTAYALPGSEARFRGAGFDHYLPKPFTTRQLLDLLPTLFRECATPCPQGDGASTEPVVHQSYAGGAL